MTFCPTVFLVDKNASEFSSDFIDCQESTWEIPTVKFSQYVEFLREIKNEVITALVEFWRHELIFDHHKTISRHGLCNQRVSNDAAYMFAYLYDTQGETQTGNTSEIRRKKAADNQFKEIISNISHMDTTVAIIYRL